ncbi:MAG: anthranilate synthase component I [Phenylobacterium sp. RIFCSPHIGHO2_01_FULL_69_31]|jgi:anthranilate synthase|uniref:anthranilate synthase component I n=1 Tax=Phenylobacterium sp. RIFCSPHIGHO2_01_FULL_69_31 TaxID=1801944 RepID=UPI0008D42F27|nr:anthranilate synthase component I [Phenylobacterium sp. RIFCSPHIGHO2_01_FULL_69_31]OHB32135.1 MAG: anthranilate synthase component I [Phenylobacterium sp. RIFCSPHIGHO2_01_FULL_69_31]
MSASHDYQTQSGIRVRRESIEGPYQPSLDALARRLDRHRGVLLCSSFEVPGRYTRWDMGFSDPPLVLTSRDRRVTLQALNARGEALLAIIASALSALPEIAASESSAAQLTLDIRQPERPFSEEQRSRQPSTFSVLRAMTDLFSSPEDPHLGLYGAFGYDLVFQFEPMAMRLPRATDQRDLVLYLPDEIIIVDHQRQRVLTHRYDFAGGAATTAGIPRGTAPDPYRSAAPGAAPRESDYSQGEYAAMVERARARFAAGDLFEVVLGQTFSTLCADAPSDVFRRLRQANPSPYGALMNLGQGEFLIAASPEMFVRVEGSRIETCPISGTIRRGRDALEDAAHIRELLNSIKDESELTMCTDVDRNDKSRVCLPGSVQVIGRRQIEMSSRLIHTVDHVEGQLAPQFDALDGFLSHAWAVTVTGAPKAWAIRHVEAEERSARRWYGGAIGRFTFDGNMNTGLTLRTIRLQSGVAEVRAGATLLHDSDPEAEEEECRLKASAMFAAIRGETSLAWTATALPPLAVTPRVLLVDHEDSFVHTLGGYVRVAGAEVTTMRPELARETLRGELAFDLVLLSPGPGRPADFAMSETLDLILRRKIPAFGVCLGLQGIVEYFGGALDVLALPMHGKPSVIANHGGRLLAGLPKRFTVGRYHSLHARRAVLPAELEATAETEDGIIMAIEHRSLPIAAVQFHPESLMTSPDAVGLPLIRSALTLGAVR